MDASDLLPIEMWTKILKEYLKLSHWITVQNVCQLFWNVIQDFVALGLIKSDFYVSLQYLNLENKQLKM